MQANHTSTARSVFLASDTSSGDLSNIKSNLPTHPVGANRPAQGYGLQTRDIQAMQALQHAHSAGYQVSSRSPVMLGRA